MRHFRASGVPAAFLAVMMGLALLLPEAGHSLAHRRASAEAPHTHHVDTSHAAEDHHAVGAHADADHPDADHAQPVLPDVATVAGGHAAGAHAHIELLASLPGKPLLAYAVAAQTVIRAFCDFTETVRVSAVTPDTPTPFSRTHGPPPPPRAPPHR